MEGREYSGAPISSDVCEPKDLGSVSLALVLAVAPEVFPAAVLRSSFSRRSALTRTWFCAYNKKTGEKGRRLGVRRFRGTGRIASVQSGEKERQIGVGRRRGTSRISSVQTGEKERQIGVGKRRG